jgi:hypothetical protein
MTCPGFVCTADWHSPTGPKTTKTLHISAQFALIERHKRHVRQERQLRNFPQSSQPRGGYVVSTSNPQRTGRAVSFAVEVGNWAAMRRTT